LTPQRFDTRVMTAIEKLLLRRTQLPGREKRHKHNRRKLVNNATKYRTLHYRQYSQRLHIFMTQTYEMTRRVLDGEFRFSDGMVGRGKEIVSTSHC